MQRMEKSIKALYRAHAPFLAGLGKSELTGEPALESLIDEALQYTFLKAYEAGRALVAHPNPRAWLARVFLNRLRPYARRARERQRRQAYSLDDPLAPEIRDPADPVDDFLRQEAEQALLKAIRQALAEREGQVYDACFGRGDSIREAAQSLGITESQVKNALQRIRAKARKIKKEFFSEI